MEFLIASQSIHVAVQQGGVVPDLIRYSETRRASTLFKPDLIDCGVNSWQFASNTRKPHLFGVRAGSANFDNFSDPIATQTTNFEENRTGSRALRQPSSITGKS